ncbi:hypothetical protein DV736_g1598, partial [Chaetothyriales sp. CBS 134916]
MSLTSMVEGLLGQAKQLDAYLAEKKLPMPTWERDTLAELPAELQNVRATLSNDANNFAKLVRGPLMSAMDIAFSWTDVLSLTVIYHYKLAEAVPADGSASYAEIASKTGLDEDLVFRFVRAAMGNRIFAEDPTTGRVLHTATSRLLATNPGFGEALGLQLEEFAPAGSRVVAAWDKWGQNTSELNQVALSLANNTDLSTFQFLGKNPQRAKRFGDAMHFYTDDDTWDLRHLMAAFDWHALDQPGALLIDVGGGMGQVSQFLARHTKNLHFLVEDLPYVVSNAIKALPAELQDRISFTVQDFLEPQVVGKTADAVLMRWVLHNWHDVYCVQILRALIPVFKPGTKVLLYEYVLEDSPVLDQASRFGMQLDLIMLTGYNGRTRTAAQFHKVLTAADPRFVLTGVHRPAASIMSLIEVTWTP